MKGFRLTLVVLAFLAIGIAPSAAAQSGLTPHFEAWLSSHGYGGYDFGRGDVPGGSTGGKTGDGDTVVNQPVIFIHGNGDSALGTGVLGMTGWSSSLAYFQSKGYRSSELYATTWGPADSLQSALQYHSQSHLERLRAFIQAVKAYTGAAKVDIVAHSMGVTLARKAIKGGAGHDSLGGGSYNLGASLTSSVDSFVGISGGNRGLVACYLTGPTTPTCGNTNGLYPGYLVGFYGPFGVWSSSPTSTRRPVSKRPTASRSGPRSTRSSATATSSTAGTRARSRARPARSATAASLTATSAARTRRAPCSGRW
jgi:hypothetical protein